MDIPFHLMAKPTGSQCNIDCHYCFYLEKPHQQQRAMSDEVLERYIADYIEQTPQNTVSFIWQGGEPTLAGLDFFEKAVVLQQRFAKGKRILNSIQTNGILLNDQWCQFLKKWQFLVGISIDGPQALHDYYRVSKSQKGTWQAVMQAIELLKSHQIPFNTLTVVNDHNVHSGTAIYQFLKEIGSTNLQFIPLMGAENQQASAKDFGLFLIEVFKQWYPQDIGRISVQFIEQWTMAFLGLQPSLCLFRKTCGDQLIIEQNGDIYSCDHYVYPQYKIGNLIETPIRQIVYSPAQQQFAKMKTQLSRQCLQCEFQFACHGGCPKHRMLTKEMDFPHNQLCEAYYMALSYMKPYLLKLASQILSKKC